VSSSTGGRTDKQRRLRKLSSEENDVVGSGGDYGSALADDTNNSHVDEMKVTFILAAISTGNAALTTGRQ